MKTLNDLRETTEADEIYGQVMCIDPFIKIRYKYKDRAFCIEMPKTEMSDHLKIGDEVDMQLLIFKEK